MLLYVNGDEISGGACAINNFVQANDDIHHTASGNKAHPDNIMHSYGYYLSRLLNIGFRSEANVKPSNESIYDGVINFVDNILPSLRSQYTVIVIGWMPNPDVKKLELLANKLRQLDVEYIFFNTKKPLPNSVKIDFGNYLDLKNANDCFIPWCVKNRYNLKNNQYPDAEAHNAWAKYLFSKMIEVL
jgi:hypothetical protein